MKKSTKRNARKQKEFIQTLSFFGIALISKNPIQFWIQQQRAINSIRKLHDFINDNGSVYFDVYKMPKIGYLHPKYFLWRPLAQKLFSFKKVAERKLFTNSNEGYSFYDLFIFERRYIPDESAITVGDLK